MRAVTNEMAEFEGEVPFLIMHGDAGTRAGLRQSERIYEALRAAGADAALRVVPGADHAGPESGWAEARQLAG